MEIRSPRKSHASEIILPHVRIHLLACECSCRANEPVGDWWRVARGVPSKVKLTGLVYHQWIQREMLIHFGCFNLRFIDLVQTQILLIMHWWDVLWVVKRLKSSAKEVVVTCFTIEVVARCFSMGLKTVRPPWNMPFLNEIGFDCHVWFWPFHVDGCTRLWYTLLHWEESGSALDYV